MDEQSTQYYVEQTDDGFCVYGPEGKKIDEYRLRRDAVKAASELNELTNEKGKVQSKGDDAKEDKGEKEKKADKDDK